MTLLRLDVHVAGPDPRSVAQDHVDDADDRRQGADPRRIRRVVCLPFDLAGRRDVLEDVEGVVIRVAGRAALQLRPHGRLRGDDGDHALAGAELDVLQRPVVERVGHRQPEGRAVEAQGQDEPLTREVGRQQRHRLVAEAGYHVRTDVLQAKTAGDR